MVITVVNLPSYKMHYCGPPLIESLSHPPQNHRQNQLQTHRAHSSRPSHRLHKCPPGGHHANWSVRSQFYWGGFVYIKDTWKCGFKTSSVLDGAKLVFSGFFSQFHCIAYKNRYLYVFAQVLGWMNSGIGLLACTVVTAEVVMSQTASQLE